MTDDRKLIFNPPPEWPTPPDGWVPPKGWEPDSSWPPAPVGWQLWVEDPQHCDILLTTGLEAEHSESLLPDANNQSRADINVVKSEINRLKEENELLKRSLLEDSKKTELVELNDELVLQNVGIYRYHHPLENAEEYKTRLRGIEDQKKLLIKSRRAIKTSNMFTFDNSLAKGRKMTGDLSKLMLRAYNAEADNCIRSLRAGNVVVAKKRIEKTRNVISSLGEMMDMYISDEYHQLQIDEFELTSDYLMKKQEEKEIAKEERAQLREEARVQKELEAQRIDLVKERSHIINTLSTLQKQGIADSTLEEQLKKIEGAIEQNDYRSANIRAGYVYVVSNRGAFGDSIVKIGLTRRLEPNDRVKELGGASVPFKFDVHALFFSEDAVTLETELHQHFTNKRVNCANTRKEFFFASPKEVLEVLKLKVGNVLEFNENAESTEYLQSVKYWPKTN